MARFALTLLLFVFAVFVAVPSRAATWYVSARSEAPSHDGTTWATAFTRLQDALEAAAAGDAVWVAEGVYGPLPPSDHRNAVLPAGVHLYGGFRGDETALGQRNPAAHVSELKQPRPGVPALLVSTGAGADTLLDGFTISAGVGLNNASPTITHNRFVPGMSPLSTHPREGTQGVLQCTGVSSPVIADNVFTGAGDVAIDCANGSPTIVNNTIAGNGAGISLYGSTGQPSVINNIIAFNSAGIYAADLSRTTIRSNCFHENMLGDVMNKTGAVTSDGNISADPRFASYDLMNFHIQPDSPCRDAGDNDAVAGTLDIDLQPRVQGGRVDMGADESDGTAWSASPRIVRVSPDGDDARDGSSWGKAMRTIQAGVDAAAEHGGEVWVRAGTYTQHADGSDHGGITLPACVKVFGGFSGTESAVSGRRVGSNATILENADGYPVVSAIAGYRNSALDGFTIRGIVSGGKADPIVDCPNGSPIIANDTFTAAAGSGPVVRGYYSSFLFQNNTVTGFEAKAPLFATQFSEPAIWRNVIRRNTTSVGGLIDMTGGLGISIRDNLFDENAIPGGAAIQTRLATVQMLNNTFVHNTAVLTTFPNVLGSVYANNIFAFNTPSGVAPPRYSPARNNCSYPGAFIEDARGNIGLDPRFVDADGGDYRLRLSSPCIDAGDTSLVLPGELDIAGEPRVRSGGVDMGAYESAGTALSPSVLDVARALQIAGGLRAATRADLSLMDVAAPIGIDDADAVAMVRKLTTTTPAPAPAGENR